MRFPSQLLLTMLLAGLPVPAASAQEQPPANDGQPAPAADDQRDATRNAPDEAGQDQARTADGDAAPDARDTGGESADSPDRQDESGASGSADADSASSDAAAAPPLTARQTQALRGLDQTAWQPGLHTTPQTVAAAEALENCLAAAAGRVRRPFSRHHATDFQALGATVYDNCGVQVAAYREAWRPQFATVQDRGEIPVRSMLETAFYRVIRDLAIFLVYDDRVR